MTVRTRVAPSPTGDPHVGTAYMALFNKAFARQAGGKFVLRIEDTDQERSTADSERMIFESLRWLGLDWDEGPDIGGEFGPYRQSERTDLYRQYAAELLEKGAAYRCFCTPERLAALRDEQRANKQTTGYDGLCRGIDPAEAARRAGAGEPHVVRLVVPQGGETRFLDKLRGEIVIQNAQVDDQVLLKTDGFPTYHLANVVDDHLMAITHIIRGEEWINSTPKHVLLYDAFGWEAPHYIHMPLLRRPGGAKISKRKDPTSLEWFRDQGFLPEVMVNFLALCGYSMPGDREIFTFDEMAAAFSFKRITLSGPVFNLEKLEWMNGEYIRALSPESLAEKLAAAGVVPGGRVDEKLLAIIPLIRERLKRFSDFPQWAGFFYSGGVAVKPEDLVPKGKSPGETRQKLAEARELLASATAWSTAEMENALRAYCETCGWKARDLFMALRVAITGSTTSPPLFESMEVLGREESLNRLDAAAEALNP